MMATENAWALRKVFTTSTDKLRQELMIEVKDLNSKLFSRCLISDTVLREQDINTTLQEIRGRLHNEEVAEETFLEFIKAVREIHSKFHLAEQLLHDCQCNKISAPLRRIHHEGNLVNISTSSYRQSEDNKVASNSEGGSWPQNEMTRQEDAIDSSEDEEQAMEVMLAEPSDGQCHEETLVVSISIKQLEKERMASYSDCDTCAWPQNEITQEDTIQTVVRMKNKPWKSC